MRTKDTNNNYIGNRNKREFNKFIQREIILNSVMENGNNDSDSIDLDNLGFVMDMAENTTEVVDDESSKPFYNKSSLISYQSRQSTNSTSDIDEQLYQPFGALLKRESCLTTDPEKPIDSASATVHAEKINNASISERYWNLLNKKKSQQNTAAAAPVATIPERDEESRQSNIKVTDESNPNEDDDVSLFSKENNVEFTKYALKKPTLSELNKSQILNKKDELKSNAVNLNTSEAQDKFKLEKSKEKTAQVECLGDKSTKYNTPINKTETDSHKFELKTVVKMSDKEITETLMKSFNPIARRIQIIDILNQVSRKRNKLKSTAQNITYK